MGTLFSQCARDKAKAAYLGLAIGDALGATVEFMTPNEIKATHKRHKNIIGGGWLRLKPGMVTDDTEMSLALGEALINAGKVNAESIAEAFSNWMRSMPVDIGSTVRRGIMHYRNHGKTSVPKSEMDAGNGACMRCLPIALVTLGYEQQTVVTASRIQAHVTHHSDLSDVATEHVIDLVQKAILGTDLNDMEVSSRVFSSKHTAFQFGGKIIINPSGYIVDTIRAVFQSLYTTSNFQSCLVDVVNKGGDADTTGAIAGMIAGAYYGLDGIPKRWLKQLDRNVREMCELQADKLMKLAPIEVPVS